MSLFDKNVAGGSDKWPINSHEICTNVLKYDLDDSSLTWGESHSYVTRTRDFCLMVISISMLLIVYY